MAGAKLSVAYREKREREASRRFLQKFARTARKTPKNALHA